MRQWPGFFITSFDTPNQATPWVFHAVSLSVHGCHAVRIHATPYRLRNGLLRILGILDSRYIFSLEQFAESLKKTWDLQAFQTWLIILNFRLLNISFHGNEKKRYPKQHPNKTNPTVHCISHAFPSKSWTFSSFRSFVAFALSAVRLVMSFANEWWGFTLIYGTDSLWMSFFRASNSSPNSVMSTFNWLTLKPRNVFGWESMKRGIEFAIERYTSRMHGKRKWPAQKRMETDTIVI